MPPLSLDARLALAMTAIGVVTAAVGLGLWWTTGALLLSVGAAAIVLVLLAVLLARRVARPYVAVVQAVTDGVSSLRDRDFSLSIATPAAPEMVSLVRAYNGLGDTLRDERQGLYQRELLLDTVIQSTPLALLLTNDRGAILYANVSARRLLLDGRKLEGHSLPALLERAPAPLREAVLAGRDELFTLEIDGEPEIFHVSQRVFTLNAQRHHLYLLKQLTRELNAQEVQTWKKVIRVIAHELNNSLAPVGSLANSGRELLRQGVTDRLDRVFATIEERALHLASFIDGYSRFAKLPRPRIGTVQWRPFVESLARAVSFDTDGPIPDALAAFDAGQLEQVLINLLKNAHESGSPPDAVRLGVRAIPGGWQVQVLDRGSGMTETVLRNALVPFYSTKPSGTGLGLTVCREVLEAHGGRLSLANRDGGGLIATLWLPAGEAATGSGDGSA